MGKTRGSFVLSYGCVSLSLAACDHPHLPEPTSVTEGSESSPFWLQEEQLKELEVLNAERAFKRHTTAGFIYLKDYEYGRFNSSCTQRKVVANERKL